MIGLELAIKRVGVSTILAQGWERGVRSPSRLACRLLDTVTKDPAAWLAGLAPITSQHVPRSRRAG